MHYMQQMWGILVMLLKYSQTLVNAIFSSKNAKNA